MKQTNLDGSVILEESISKQTDDQLTDATLIIEIYKFVGKWIPEYPNNKLSEENIFDIVFKDSFEKERVKKIIHLEVNRINSILKEFGINRDKHKIIATNSKLLDAINKCFLALSIEPIGKNFFEVVLGLESLYSNRALQEHVEKVNMFSMYFFGSFEHAYENLKSASQKEVMKHYLEIFPDKDEENRRISKFQEERLQFDDIEKISGWDLWCLGYLAKSYLDSINKNRKKLLPLLLKAKENGITNADGFDKLAREESYMFLDPTIRKAALDYSSKPYGIYDFYLSFEKRLNNAIEICSAEITEKHFDKIREKGRQNTSTYLTLNDIDIYIATSMRSPCHFTTTEMLINDLFKIPDIKELNLRYFDPTQSFSHDRIDKGLIECLMIKKARVTIYNAQESDTFGKDSEAAVTLAEGGDVIVYIARLFSKNIDFKNFYEDLNNVMIMDDSEGLEDILRLMKRKQYATDSELEEIIRPGTGKAELIILMIQNEGLKLIQNTIKDDNKLKEELDSLGYEHFPSVAPTTFLLPETTVYNDIIGKKWTYELFALCIMINLEKRALVFKEGHPLSLQTSPEDGIARGVIITRSILTTAEVLKALLIRTLGYYVEYGKYACLLRDNITKSPVRVITRDKNLSVAFWYKHQEGRKKIYFNNLD